MKKIMLSIAIVVLSFFCFTAAKVKAASYRTIDNVPYNVYNVGWIADQSLYPGFLTLYCNFTVDNSGDSTFVYLPLGLNGFESAVFDYDLIFYNGYGESNMIIQYFETGNILVEEETRSLFYDFRPNGVNGSEVTGYILDWGLNTADYDYIYVQFFIECEIQSGGFYSIQSEMYNDNFFSKGIYQYLSFTNWNDIVVPMMENSLLTEGELINSYNSGYELGVIEGASYTQSLIDDAYTDGYGDALNEGITTSWFLNMMNGVAAIFNIEVFDGVKLSFFIFFPLVIGLIGRFFWLRRGGGNG